MTNGPLGDTGPKQDQETFSAVLNMSYFMIKHYYNLYGQNKNAEWLLADLLNIDSFDQICKDLLESKPDILGLSIFLWNESLQYNIAKFCKKHLPSTKIVMGGPHLDAHKDTAWFDKFPYVDYVVYGDGEKAFQQIIDYTSEVLSDKTTWVNIVEKIDGEYIKYPFEQLTDSAYFSSSAFLGQQDFVNQHIDYLISREVPREHLMITIEFARGCMYSCSFCDWSQNLTKKVKRRKFDWKNEINYWHSLDVAIREADANFGQWDEDREIYDYALTLFDPKKNFRFMVWNNAKLKKNVTHFLINNARHYGARVRFGMQDVNEEVLRLMDRPSLTWKQHIEMLEEVRAQPDIDRKLIAVQLMLGVAGQSYDSFVDSMMQLWDAGVYIFQLNHWMLLPNSPAAEPLYQKMHKLKWKKVWYVYRHPAIKNEDLDAIYKAMQDNAPMQKKFVEGNAIFSTSTIDFTGIMAIHILWEYLKEYKIDNPEYDKIKNFRPIMLQLKEQALLEAQRQWALHEPMIDRYGFAVLGRYDTDTKTLNRWF